MSDALTCGGYADFRFAVAYARASGVRLLQQPISDFIRDGGFTQGIVGVNQGNTSYQALSELHDIMGSNLHVRFGKSFSPSFHPKLYLFGKRRETFAPSAIITGSFNLTRGGLKENEECGGIFESCDNNEDICFTKRVTSFWENVMQDSDNFSVLPASQELLSDLLEKKALIDEHESRREGVASPNEINQIKQNFINSLAPQFSCFVMTLSQFDTSECSADPVILIPLRARDQDKNFWFWPHFFHTRETTLAEFTLVSKVTADDTPSQENIRIYDYPQKSEFRLKAEKIKRSGKDGDILLVRRRKTSMDIELIRVGSNLYERYQNYLQHQVSSQKRYGYFNE